MWDNTNHMSVCSKHTEAPHFPHLSFTTFLFFFSGAWMSELLQSSSVITETWNICCLSTEDWCKHLNTKGPPAAPVLRQLTNISCQSETRLSDRRRSHIAFFSPFFLLEELSDDWKQRREQTKSLCNCSNCSSAPATISENKWSFKMLYFFSKFSGRLGHTFWVWRIKCLSAKLLYTRFTILKVGIRDYTGKHPPSQKIYLWWESTFFSTGWLTRANNFYTK